MAGEGGFVNEVDGGQNGGEPRPKVETGRLFQEENGWERRAMGRKGLGGSGGRVNQVERTV